MLTDFVQQILGVIDSKITSPTDDEIKNHSHLFSEQLIELYTRLFKMTSWVDNGEDISTVQTNKVLDLQEKLLYSPYIEKKIQAINKMIRMTSTRQYPIPAEKNIAMKSIISPQWNIVKYVFTEANHPELITRFGDFVKEMASRQMLTNEHIEMFWDVAQNSPISAVQEATLDLITKIIKSAEEDQVQLMIKLAANIDPTHITEKYLKFLESLYLSVLQNIKE